jgi:hypothetical protein
MTKVTAASGGNMAKAAPRFICSEIVSSFASFQGAADYFDGSAKRARSGLSGLSGMNWNSIKPA